MFSIKDFISNPPSHKNTRGKNVYKIFSPDSGYLVDLDPNFSDWEKYLPGCNAFSGEWVNPKKLMSLSYTEGDWQLVIFNNEEEYNENCLFMKEFYKRINDDVISDNEGTNSTQITEKFLITI